MDFSNLEVFILTYNRANFLKDQLTAVCEQTAQGFDIIVMDNASTDNTADVVKDICTKYSNRNIKHIVNETNIGGVKNLHKAIDLASKEWTCILCDDDIIHPFYIEYALKAINKYPEIGLISSNSSFYINPDNCNWNIPSKTVFKLFSKHRIPFADILQNATWRNLLCKTELFKKHRFDEITYGKHSDVMVIRKILSEAPGISFIDPMIKVRIHNEQDCINPATAPKKEQLYNIYTDSLNLVNKKCLFDLFSWFRAVKYTNKPYSALSGSYNDVIDDFCQKKYISRLDVFWSKHLLLMSVFAAIQLLGFYLKYNILGTISERNNNLVVLYFCVTAYIKKFLRIN